jgi:hypothetical protein
VKKVQKTLRLTVNWLQQISFVIKPTACTNFTNLFCHENLHVSWQNKFVKLVHLVGFITKKFVTMHSHMNVKLVTAKSVSATHSLSER